MKAVFFLILFFLLSCRTIAQVNGGFYYGVYEGQRCIYFEGINESGKELHDVKVWIVNEALNQRQEYELKVMKNRDTFMLGPANNWIWQLGEKLYIKYPDGRFTCWVCKLSLLNYPYGKTGTLQSGRIEIEANIERLKYKIRDAERSLRTYERMNDRHPSVTGMMLVMEQMRLIQTYRNQLEDLIAQLYINCK